MAAAITGKHPVVALESAILRHGLVYPANVELCTQLQKDLVRTNVVPATTAVIDGVIRVGLSDEAINTLGKMAVGLVALLTRSLLYRCCV